MTQQLREFKAEHVEALAQLMATTLNGGSWDVHFGEKHKTFWREQARLTCERIAEDETKL